jgi:PIN domain nuclease of toxin-antitoxin system
MPSANLVVLDTHAWIWWVTQSKKLSRRAKRAIESARQVGLPAACCWEMAMLVAAGRLKLDREVRQWVRDAMDVPRLLWLELSPDIAVSAGSVAASFHGDPIDRMVVATALELRAPLISADDKLAGWPGLETIW